MIPQFFEETAKNGVSTTVANNRFIQKFGALNMCNVISTGKSFNDTFVPSIVNEQ